MTFVSVCMRVFVWWTYQLFKIWFDVDTQLLSEYAREWYGCGEWLKNTCELKNRAVHTFLLLYLNVCASHIRKLKSSTHRVGFIANETYCHSLNEHSYLLVPFQLYITTHVYSLVYFQTFHINSRAIRNL